MGEQYIKTGSSGFYSNGNIYVANYDSILLRIDIQSGDIYLEASLGDLEIQNMIRFLIRYKDSLFLIPGSTSYITKIDLQFNKHEHFKLDAYRKFMSPLVFSTYVLDGNYLYLFPGKMPYILCINLDTMQQKYLDNPLKKYQCKCNRQLHFSKDSIQMGRKVYLASSNYPVCYSFDLDTLEIHELAISEEVKGGIQSLVLIDGKISLLDAQNNLYICDTENSYTRIEIGNQESCYSRTVYAYKKLWLIPVDRNQIAYYDFDKSKLVHIEFDKGFCFAAQAQYTFFDLIQFEENVYLVPRYCNMLIQIDLKTARVKFVKLRYSEQYINELLRISHTVYESAELSLVKYIHYTKNMYVNAGKTSTSDKYGVHIFSNS